MHYRYFPIVQNVVYYLSCVYAFLIRNIVSSACPGLCPNHYEDSSHWSGDRRYGPKGTGPKGMTVLSNIGRLWPGSSIIRHIGTRWEISYTHQSIATIEPKYHVYKQGITLLGIGWSVLGRCYFNIAVDFHHTLHSH